MPILCRYCADTADISAIRFAMMDSIKIHHKIFFDFGLYEKVLTGWGDFMVGQFYGGAILWRGDFMVG